MIKIISKTSYMILLLSTILVSTSANAVYLDSNDTMRADFNIATSHSSGYDYLNYSFSFYPTLGGDPLSNGEGWTVRAFDSFDNQIGSQDFLNPFFSGGIGISIGMTFDAPDQLSNSTGYLVFDDIIGSFDFTKIEIELGFFLEFGSGRLGPVEGEVTVSSVPEPGALSMLILGIAIFFFFFKWKHNNALVGTNLRVAPVCPTV